MTGHKQLMLCAHCGEPFTDNTDPNSGGRPALFCSSRCRLRAWRRRQ
jgi:endogenous inhibitor of DNA gyrase (YacG/DUF329 family)